MSPPDREPTERRRAESDEQGGGVGEWFVSSTVLVWIVGLVAVAVAIAVFAILLV